MALPNTFLIKRAESLGIIPNGLSADELSKEIALTLSARRSIGVIERPADLRRKKGYQALVAKGLAPGVRVSYSGIEGVFVRPTMKFCLVVKTPQRTYTHIDPKDLVLLK